MSTQLTVPATTLKELVKTPAIAGRMREVLGQRAPQFVSSLISIGDTMRDVEPRSIIAAAMTAAALDLPIDKNLGFAWIVPYREGDQKYAQFQMGYKGFIQLALRTGQYKKMNATAVNAEAWGGYDEVGDPIIKWDLLDFGKPAIAYAFAWQTVSGFTKVFAWTKERVISHAKRYSQAYVRGRNTPWKTHFEEMAIKSVIRMALSHWGIMSVEMRQAVILDQSIQKDVDAEVTYPDALPLGKPDDDDGDLGPQKQVEAETPTIEAKISSGTVSIPGSTMMDVGGPTPQQALAKVVTDNGLSFDDYRKVGIESEWFKGHQPDTWESFDMVPTEIATDHVAAHKFIVKKIKGGK